MAQWTQLPSYLHSIAAGKPGSVLLETSRFDALNRCSYLFLDPIETIVAASLNEIPELFRRIEDALSGGFHVAGFLDYECGYHFEHFESVDLPPQDRPIAWFGIYAQHYVYDHAAACFQGAVPFGAEEAAAEQQTWRPFTESATLSISEAEYGARIGEIKQYIRAGDTYQVNFTDSVSAQTSSTPGPAFTALLLSQPVAYSALINLGNCEILSLSPELFFRIADGRIVTRPMKGTMSRGLDCAEDTEQATRLKNDAKNRSEHVMIVDLLRNDLGRICTMGSVQVEDIFSVEKYETLLQMTSTITGTLRPAVRYYEIFKSMFPSGSITGAPKLRTMQIIREMERKPRGIYTGAIGFMSPSGSSVFNVAIRTLILKNGIAQMGVGGGIVADSEAAEEYRECLLKTRFLTHPPRTFQLIETMLWENGELPFLLLHLDRLEASASYFDFKFDRSDLLARIDDTTRDLPGADCYRIRLLLDASGIAALTATNFMPETAAISVRLSDKATNSTDVFLRHKTTHRELYESEYTRARGERFDEVIFVNERGEVTEGAISNIFVLRDDRLLTPPLSSGVLPGVYRRHLLETDSRAEEHVLTRSDLESAEAIYLCNSIRGMRKVKSLVTDFTKASEAVSE